MKHVLDNPVWNALISANNYLGTGSERVKFFYPEVSPFASCEENGTAGLQELYDFYTADSTVFLWAGDLLSVPDKWEVKHCISGLQMIYDHPTVKKYDAGGIVPLTEKDIPEMIALTRLTRPGPFATRTIEFGNYEGIFEDGILAAMTGQRFHCFDHVEISAVCTNPDHLGKGYAKRLLLSQLTQIIASGSKPYLHVREDNERAIHVYQSLGFSVRRPVYFYVIRKKAF